MLAAMRRSRLLLGLIPLAPLSVLFAACGQGEVARLGLVMEAPAGLLDTATAVKLSVFAPGSSRCGASGHVNGIPAGAQAFDLSKTGCAAGAAWCKTIELDKDGSTKMFAVVATGATGTLAEGCATAKIDQDPLDVSIKVQRFNPPKCCNDGILQAGEQCDNAAVAQNQCDGTPGGKCLGITADAVCACDCLAAEIPLDRAAGTATNPPALTKTAPAFAFGPGTGALLNGLRAAFTDTDTSAAGGSDVAIRVLKEDFFPDVAPPVLGGPLRIPLLCANTKGPGSVRKQQNASIATISSDTMGVVYESNENLGSRLDIYFSAQSSDGCANALPVQVNTTTTGNSNRPDIAGGPGGTGLVVWSTDAGQVLGRIVSPTGVMGAEIPIASNAKGAKVTGGSTGWTVVYQGSGGGDGDGVLVKSVSASGVAGAEKLVNAVTQGLQDQPDVASLDDGRMIVSWRSNSDIFAQRFDKGGSPLAGDQESPVSTVSTGDQGSPAVAASVGFGEFYVVAWEHALDSTVHARLLGANGGFLFNSVSGQNDDFDATHPQFTGTGIRKAPAVAIGGGGFIAIGWEDDSADHAGVWVRRFPQPAQ